MLGAMMLTDQTHKLNCANQAILGVPISMGHTHRTVSMLLLLLPNKYIRLKSTHLTSMYYTCVRLYGNDDGNDDCSGGDGGGWFGLGLCITYQSIYSAETVVDQCVRHSHTQMCISAQPTL